MFSYTDLARTKAPTMIPPVEGASSTQRAEQWFNSLPVIVQEKVKARAAKIVASMPEAVQLTVANKLLVMGESIPVPIALDGLGCPCENMQGLGAWGALIDVGMALGQAGVQFGTDYLLQQQSLNAQGNLQSAALAANAQNQAARDKAAAEMQQLVLDAQLESARLAQQGFLEQAKINAPALFKFATYGGIAALALAVGGAVYFMRKRK